MTLKLSNNASSLLSSSIDEDDTSLTITSGDEGKFPTLGAGEWHPLTVYDGAGNMEIMRCTARTGINLTVVRAQENTTAKVFAAGARVDIRQTAGVFAALVADINRSLARTGGRHNANVAGSADVILAAGEAENGLHVLTGLITADIHYVIPAVPRFFIVENRSTGAYSITVTTDPEGDDAELVVPQGYRQLVECDGANVLAVDFALPVDGFFVGRNAADNGRAVILSGAGDRLGIGNPSLGQATAGALVIASDAITPTAAWHTVDTEAEAESDDLVTIATTHIADGGLLLISAANAARVVTVKHQADPSAGQVYLQTGHDFRLNNTRKALLLQRRGDHWVELVRGKNVNEIADAFLLTGELTPAEITANQDNYNPTGLAGVSVLRVSTDAARTMTGLAGGAPGRMMLIGNVGSNNLTLVHDATSTEANRFSLPSGLPLVLLPTEWVLLRYDATLSRWIAVSYPVRAAFTAGDYSNLRIDVTGNATVDVDADRLTVYDAVGRGFRLGTVDLTLNLGNSGENGLDTGAEASNTWYAIHVIYNPATNTIAGLLSTSAASPTLPSGYVYSRRIGWVRNNGSSNLFRTRQRNEEAGYISGTNPATPLAMANGLAGSVTTPTFVAVAVGSFVPPSARGIVVHLVAGGTAMAAPNNSYGAYNTRANPAPVVVSAEAGISFSSVQKLLLESANIYWAANNNSNNNLYVTGWEDNL